MPNGEQALEQGQEEEANTDESGDWESSHGEEEEESVLQLCTVVTGGAPRGRANGQQSTSRAIMPIVTNLAKQKILGLAV